MKNILSFLFRRKDTEIGTFQMEYPKKTAKALDELREL